jgi:hypothetical protein
MTAGARDTIRRCHLENVTRRARKSRNSTDLASNSKMEVASSKGPREDGLFRYSLILHFEIHSNRAEKSLMLSRWPWFIIVIVALLTINDLLSIPCVNGPSCPVVSPAIQGIWVSYYFIGTGAVAIVVIRLRLYNLMLSYYAAQLVYIAGLFVLFVGLVLWGLGLEPDCNPCTSALPYFIPTGNVLMVMGAVLCVIPIFPKNHKLVAVGVLFLVFFAGFFLVPFYPYYHEYDDVSSNVSNFNFVDVNAIVSPSYTILGCGIVLNPQIYGAVSTPSLLKTYSANFPSGLYCGQSWPSMIEAYNGTWG